MTNARPSPEILGFPMRVTVSFTVVLAELREKALVALDDPTSTLGLFEWSTPYGRGLDDLGVGGCESRTGSPDPG